MKKCPIILLVLMLNAINLSAQNRTIKGKVIAEDLEALAITQIYINDTVLVGKTDMSGLFEIQIPNAVKQIALRNVGIETTVINLSDTCNSIEVIMMHSITYDFRTLKQVDRLRMRRFKKLPALRTQAFEKGIFTSDKACYYQQLIPYYEKN
jgi:hypothetical protein